MQTKSDIHLHLSIWRPAVIDRRYLYTGNQASQDGAFIPVADGSLLEQIYAWDAGSNDVLGACSPSVSQRIRERLVNPFASNELPKNRSVRYFRDAVEEILGNSSLQNETYWTDCQETVKPEGSEEINVRANVVLAMLRHFHWIACVFLHVPKASVLVR